MFEITAKDIALLKDDDFRLLIGLLSESELRKRGLPVSSVTYGGHQDAKDGGLDVRVALAPSTEIDGFIPCPSTGFQVKAQAMSPSAIRKEMCPSGNLRSVICDLATNNGAYIIASSKDSVTDTALNNRLKAMLESVSILENSKNLKLDFYDCVRIATWIRDHAGLVLWVREKIGRPLIGWQAYGPWAYDPKGTAGEYLLDNDLKIKTRNKEVGPGLSVIDGIARIRHQLAAPQGVVRLVGLSGVGKTRLAQALFDERISESALNPSLAIYTNMADDPTPQPSTLVSEMIATHTSAILVVDNCAPELHRRLSELCRSSHSQVRVITIEYDIREDQPEGTDVFDLQPSSNELIEKLLYRRFPTLSQVDRQTLAKFSGGNARIAIALANTVRAGEAVAHLRDEELFQRLFRQRHEHDPSLLLTAQACSLVYSFEGEDTSAPRAELFKLGALVGQRATEIFHNVSELQRRDLVQRRSVWRALLPHAVANRLATLALQNIPLTIIETQFFAVGSERLLRSFTRRLSYLHTSKEAIALVSRWLEPNGILGRLDNLNDLGKAMFENITPVAPEVTLSVLERTLLATTDNNIIYEYESYIHILRSLAYDAELFDRCITLIIKIVKANDKAEWLSNGHRDLFASLFFLYLSGTQAEIPRRLKVIERLSRSEDIKERGLGVTALKAALEADHFTVLHNFEFGAHSRDHGFWPRNGQDIKNWYRPILDLAKTLGCSEELCALPVRQTLADQFSGLWVHAGMHDELETVCSAFAAKCFWPEGWIAVRRTQHFWSTKLTPEILQRLTELERLLHPNNLEQNVKSMVFRNSPGSFELDLMDEDNESIQSRLEKMETAAQSLGKAVAEDENVLTAVLPDIVKSEGRLISFGYGLALNTDRPQILWNRLVTELASVPIKQQRIQVFSGILQALRIKTPELVEILLDDALENEALEAWYPVLQVDAGVNEKGVERLLKSLTLGKAPMARYRGIGWGRSSDSISGNNFKRLVHNIAIKEEGFEVACEIVGMRLYSDKDKKEGYDPSILEAGRELMQKIQLITNQSSREDYHSGEIARICLSGKDCIPIVQEICARLGEAISKHKTSVFYHDDLLQNLFTVHPVASLDGLFGKVTSESHVVRRFQHDFRSEVRKNPFDHIPEDELLVWCQKDPTTRFPMVAGLISISGNMEDAGPKTWRPIALKLLDKASNRIDVLKQFVGQFMPSGWSGSLAVILESNAHLLDQLTNYPDEEVRNFVITEQGRLKQIVEDRRKEETAEDRARDERFE